MAEILLKNMEMPDCCNYCVGMVVYAKDTDGIWKDTCKLTGKPIDLNNRDGRPSDCPLIEVPPHGRLIDADILRMKYEYGDGRKKVDESPTIIEAST